MVIAIARAGSPGLVTAEVARDIHNDDAFLDVFLGRLSPATQDAYGRDISRFRQFTGKPLRDVTVRDMVEFRQSLAGAAPNSQKRMLAAAKSVLTFAHKIGYIPYNVGPASGAIRVKDTLAERILSTLEVHQMIGAEPNPRNMALLLLLYATGGRVSEICGLKWRDTSPRDHSEGQVTLFGKGGKTRAVLLTRDTWGLLVRCRRGAGPDDPVFRSEKGGHLSRVQVWRIVGAAAERVGIEGKPSPHWFRHSHVTHALDAGCPAHLVQATVGHSDLSITGKYAHVRPDDSSARYLGI